MVETDSISGARTLNPYYITLYTKVSTINAIIKTLWLEALRSNKYKQGQCCLAKKDDKGQTCYCCLGVLTDLYVNSPEGQEAGAKWGDTDSYDRLVFVCQNYRECHYLSTPVREWAELANFNPDLLTDMTGNNSSCGWLNDRGYSFEKIAELIEANL